MPTRPRHQVEALLLVLLGALSGCQRATRTGSPQRQPETAGAASPKQMPSASQTPEQGAADTSANQQDCVRGAPVPLLSSTPNGKTPTFERLGPYEARERVVLEGGIELTIRQFGCDHYAVEYVFALPGEKPTDRSPAGWLLRAADLLRNVRVSPAQVEAIQSIAATLRQKAANPYTYGAPLRMSDMETVSATVESMPHGARLVMLYDVAL